VLLAVTLLGAIGLSGPSVCAVADSAARATAPDYEALYRGGRTYVEFRDAATQRRQAWRDHYARAVVGDAALSRVHAAPGAWLLLVVAEDWCGDSANTIPYLAKLADLADNLELRIINSRVGRQIMESHRTPDGRAATPTVLLLDERFKAVGCFIERPGRLQAWFLENPDRLDDDELYRKKYEWYAQDAGAATINDAVAMIEAAASGHPSCGG
jgi:hypothetical protein